MAAGKPSGIVGAALPRDVSDQIVPLISTGEPQSASRRRIPFAVALVLGALVLRVIAAFAVERILIAAGYGGFLGPLSGDDLAYDRVAWQPERCERDLRVLLQELANTRPIEVGDDETGQVPAPPAR